MKLTPLDIHHKEFHRAIRGYNEEEVDKFLDEVAEEFERLFKENIELREQVEKVKQELQSYASMEKTLQNTLLTAQKSAEDITVHAQKEAELIIRDAEMKAKEILQETYELKRKYESTLTHLKQAEEEFRTKFKSMLESYMRIADSTAVLADIGNSIAEMSEQASSEIEKIVLGDSDSPKMSVVPIEEGQGSQNLAPGDYVSDAYLPEGFVPGNYGNSTEPAVGSITEIKREDADKTSKTELDSLAF
ncbi:MAG: DivIVA domain-containing protein [Actinomycetota bacterium]|nr:DivIVA domain-containing protein [Actinomycetota bacterium]